MPELKDLLDTALRHHGLGEREAAERLYREILARDARHHPALHLLGVIHYQAGKHDEAIDLIWRAIQIDAGEATYFDNLGLALQKRRRFEEAIAAHTGAIRLRNNFAAAYSNLGLALQQCGRFDEAVSVLRTAVALAPALVDAHFNLGNVLRAQEQYSEAVASYRTTVVLQPGHWMAYANLGSALKSLGQLEPAVQAYQEAIRLQPRSADTYFGLGNAFKEFGRYAEAIAAYRAALGISAQQPQGAMASDVARSGQPALSRPEDFIEAKYNLALALMASGAYEAAWPLYESRSQTGKMEAARQYAQPRWSGQDLTGKTVFLYAEQGMGDTIQFSRYAALVAARGARVILEVPGKMLRLLDGLAGVDCLLWHGAEIPPFDFHSPLMSLPGVFGTTVATVPAQVSYLTHDAARRALWRERLAAGGVKIGIVWQGNPHSPAERGRSAPLAAFASLAQVPGVRLISLQKVDGLEQLDHLPPGMQVETLDEDFDNGLDAFIDTAAVMMELDLIVSVDTSIAHLGAALGRPVWLALQAVPHWVWMMEPDDSPWYPTVLLFRQRTRGDWVEVFQRMAGALRERASASD